MSNKKMMVKLRQCLVYKEKSKRLTHPTVVTQRDNDRNDAIKFGDNSSGNYKYLITHYSDI